MPNRIGAAAVSWGAPRGAPAIGPAKFGPPEKAKLDIVGASDITTLPGGKFAVVADRRDLLYLTDGQKVTDTLHLPNIKDGRSMMEGVAFDERRGSPQRAAGAKCDPRSERLPPVQGRNRRAAPAIEGGL